MAIPKRTATTGTFFITTITHDRRRLFHVTRNAQLFTETLQHYRAEGHYKLHAFVVMPDHVHLLLTPINKTISEVMNFIKGGFSHRLASEREVWQKGFADHLVQNAEDFQTRRTYIHENPVKAHLSESPELYPHSSAYRPT